MATKLNEEQVRAIRQGAARGDSPRELAMLYQLGLETIRRVIRRETWAHLPDTDSRLDAAIMRKGVLNAEAPSAITDASLGRVLAKLGAEGVPKELPTQAREKDPRAAKFFDEKPGEARGLYDE